MSTSNFFMRLFLKLQTHSSPQRQVPVILDQSGIHLIHWSLHQVQLRIPGVSRPRIRRSYMAWMPLDQKIQLGS